MTANAHRLERLEDLSASVRPEHILRAHYPDLGPVVEEVRATAAAMAVHALELASPVAWLREVAIREVDGTRVELDGGAIFSSSALAAMLRGGSSVQMFLVTLGPRLDERVTELFNAMDGLEGLFLDTAGWVVVQSALSSVRRRLGERARADGYRVTRRVGPGYLDWALEEAPILVSALAAGTDLPGIEVLDSGAILPEKTLTGLYGLIPQATSN